MRSCDDGGRRLLDSLGVVRVEYAFATNGDENKMRKTVDAREKYLFETIRINILIRVHNNSES